MTPRMPNAAIKMNEECGVHSSAIVTVHWAPRARETSSFWLSKFIWVSFDCKRRSHSYIEYIALNIPSAHSNDTYHVAHTLAFVKMQLTAE